MIDSPAVRCDTPLGAVAPPAPAFTDNVYVIADEGAYVAVTVTLEVPVTVQTLATALAQPAHAPKADAPATDGAVIVVTVPNAITFACPLVNCVAPSVAAGLTVAKVPTGAPLNCTVNVGSTRTMRVLG